MSFRDVLSQGKRSLVFLVSLLVFVFLLAQYNTRQIAIASGTIPIPTETVTPEASLANRTPITHVVYLPNIVMPPVSDLDAVARTAEGFVQINASGFGDRENSWAWSMAWFKGKLYVGTNRNFNCVQTVTIEFYFPTLGLYPPGDPHIPCPTDRYDLNLRAEIWQYTPETDRWKRVFQSEEIDNPRSPGKKVARDIGFRAIAVYAQNGIEALYVGSLSANEFIPELATTHPARILSSNDGETFTPIPGDPGIIKTIYGDLRPNGFRAMRVLNGRLFATATSGLLGDGVVLEIVNPAGPNPTFTQISPATLPVYEMEVFNDRLYLGGGSPIEGYSIWTMNVADTKPYALAPVVTNGAGRGATIMSVVSMEVFKGRLYVGSCGIQVITALCELIRIAPDNTWDLVVGNSRTTAQGLKFPISGLPDGFANPFNIHFWRMEEYQGALYLGTYDNSWWYRVVPWLDPFIKTLYGFDLFMTQDGVYWSQLTGNGFGHSANVGVRNLVSAPTGLFLGTANDAAGAEVWLSRECTSAAHVSSDPEIVVAAAKSQPSCPHAGMVSDGGFSLDMVNDRDRVTELRSSWSPTRLEVETQPGATVLSWDDSFGAVRYHILRAEHRLAKDISSAQRPVSPRLVWIDPELQSLPVKSGEVLPPETWIPGEFSEIGTTSARFFIDHTAKVGGAYSYQIQAENTQGEISSSSNLVVAPSFAQDITFDRVAASIRDLTRQSKSSAQSVAPLLEGLVEAQIVAAGGDWAGALDALKTLRRKVVQNQDHAMDSLAMEDLEILIAKLERRASLIQQGVLSAEKLR